jgi:hypothetical protein
MFAKKPTVLQNLMIVVRLQSEFHSAIFINHMMVIWINGRCAFSGPVQVTYHQP